MGVSVPSWAGKSLGCDPFRFPHRHLPAFELRGRGCPSTVSDVQFPSPIVPIGHAFRLSCAHDIERSVRADPLHRFDNCVAHDVVHIVSRSQQGIVHCRYRIHPEPMAVQVGGGSRPVGYPYHDPVTHRYAPPFSRDVVPFMTGSSV